MVLQTSKEKYKISEKKALYDKIENMNEKEILEIERQIAVIKKEKSKTWNLEQQIHNLHQATFYISEAIKHLNKVDEIHANIIVGKSDLIKLKKYFEKKWKELSEIKPK